MPSYAGIIGTIQKLGDKVPLRDICKELGYEPEGTDYSNTAASLRKLTDKKILLRRGGGNKWDVYKYSINPKWDGFLVPLCTTAKEVLKALEAGPKFSDELGRFGCQHHYITLKNRGHPIHRFRLGNDSIYYKEGDELAVYNKIIERYPRTKDGHKFQEFKALLDGHLKSSEGRRFISPEKKLPAEIAREKSRQEFRTLGIKFSYTMRYLKPTAQNKSRIDIVECLLKEGHVSAENSITCGELREKLGFIGEDAPQKFEVEFKHAVGTCISPINVGVLKIDGDLTDDSKVYLTDAERAQRYVDALKRLFPQNQ